MTGAQHKYGGASRTTESEPDTGRKADAELCGTGILPVWRRETPPGRATLVPPDGLRETGE